MDTNTLRRMAVSLTAGDPLACALKADGSLVVINQRGQKLFFSREECQRQLLKINNKTTAKAAGKEG